MSKEIKIEKVLAIFFGHRFRESEAEREQLRVDLVIKIIASRGTKTNRQKQRLALGLIRLAYPEYRTEILILM